MKIKNIVLTMYLLLISTLSFAQIQKNAWGIAGNFETNYVKEQGVKNGSAYKTHFTAMNISPSFNYCVSNRLMLSANVTATPSNNSSNSDYFGISGRVRYYFTPQKEWKTYSQIILGKDSDNKGGLSGNLSIGANKFLNPHIALNMNMGFGNISRERDAASDDGYAFFKVNFENINTFRKEGDTTSTSQKRLSLGGQFLTSYNLDDKELQVILAPEIAYYIFPKIMIGIDIHSTMASVGRTISLPLLNVFGR